MFNWFSRRILIAVIIAFATFVIAFFLVVVIIVANWNKISSLDADAKEREGTEFGKSVDQRGCIQEGLKRGKKIELFNINEQVNNQYFVRGCLKTSRTTAGFCDGVPSGWKNIFNDWDEKECERINQQGAICEGILGEQIEFCEH